MSHRQRATALFLAGVFASTAFAQAPPPGQPQGYPSAPRVAPYPHALTQRRSIVHTNPFPYRGYYDDDSTGGYRNPDGVGRVAEWYPPGNRFQIDPLTISHTASFDTTPGVPNRQEQLAAQQVGIARNNSLQSHIDNYARPFYGLGVGYYGGMY